MIDISRRALARHATELMADHVERRSIALQLAAALIAMGKSKDYELLAGDVAYLLETAGAAAEAKVTSAVPLSDSQKGKLLTEIKDRTGVKKVIITEVVDPSVIGGVRTETALYSWDNTVSGKINRLRRTFSSG